MAFVVFRPARLWVVEADGLAVEPPEAPRSSPLLITPIIEDEDEVDVPTVVELEEEEMEVPPSTYLEEDAEDRLDELPEDMDPAVAAL